MEEKIDISRLERVLSDDARKLMIERYGKRGGSKMDEAMRYFTVHGSFRLPSGESIFDHLIKDGK